MVNTYSLLNPYISGDFKSNVKARNSLEAANILYKKLSEHFNNSVPKFHFTIQKGHGKYYHFKVNEKRQNNEVSFSLQPYLLEGTINMDKFIEKLTIFKNKINQKGGESKNNKKHHKKHHKKDDSSTDSSTDSDDFYKIERSYIPLVNQPFYYWWYDPYVYRLDSLWIPTFYSYITPYIEISMI